MTTKNLNIIFKNEKFSFKKLLGISLIERNINLAKIMRYNQINIICSDSEIKTISYFIKNKLVNKLTLKNIEIKYNLPKEYGISIQSNDLYDYKLIKNKNSIGEIFKFKIANIKNKKDYLMSIKEMYIRIDKPPAENIFFFTNLINRPLGKILVKILINTNITPNFITLLVFISALIATLLLFNIEYHYTLLSIFFYQLSSSLDCVDGPIARFRYQTSDFGSLFDSYIDKTIKFLLYLGLGLSSYIIYGNIISIYLSIILITINILIHTIDFNFIKNKEVFNKKKPISSKINLRNILNSDLNIIGIGCIFILLRIPNIYLHILVIYFTIILFFYLYKSIKYNLL